MIKRLFAVCAVLATLSATAQCDAGQTEVTFQIFTDAWGYEMYWEVVPTGQPCGEGALLSGGNGVDVGCDGEGLEGSTDTAMDSNISFFTDPICLTTGESYDFIFVDDYGDGGITVEVYFDGALATMYIGEGFGNVWTFEAGTINLPEYDSPCGAELVEVDGPGVIMNNEEAIAAIGEVTPGGGNCQAVGIWCEGGVAHSVWAMFEAPESGNVWVSSCNSGTNFDTQIAVWGFEDCLDQSTFDLKGSNDDVPGGCGNGAYYSSSCAATCLQPGSMYLVQIDGWYGSVGDVELTVTETLPEPALVAFGNNVNCAPDKGEEAFGSIFSWVTGWGTETVVSWTGPDGFTSDQAIVGELAPGVYTGVWSSPCSETTFEQTIEITVADPYSIGTSITQPSCPLSTDGSIEVVVAGATPPYGITLTGEDEFTSNEFETLDLGVGAYTLLVTDANGCEFTQDITLEDLNDFEFSLGDDFEICLDQDSLIFGPGGYFYEWNTGAIDQFLYLDAEELGVGTYPFILTAYNNEGCEYSDAIIVTVWSCANGVEEWFGPEVQLFPNPSTGVFTLEGLPRIHEGRLQLLDQTGRAVHSEGVPVSPGAALEVSTNLPAGVYLFRYEEDGKRMETRVVIR
ncbi:MAG: hypothetical protein ACPF83_00770 [Flavobacteriales bacterium]